ncbi:hypothetical protein TNCV_69861 [Trichonephila clavipes]|nr:hypothetical protein TNCV_69861 [Trichonephila clavipes]
MIENQKVRVEESFIDFIETKNKTTEGISDMIESKLKADGLDIMNCRGQAYDNAATMAGCHTGVQQRIKNINLNAEFVPCSNHSLNLVCVHVPSVETVLEAKLEEFMDDALIYAKGSWEELEISFEPPR